MSTIIEKGKKRKLPLWLKEKNNFEIYNTHTILGHDGEKHSNGKAEACHTKIEMVFTEICYQRHARTYSLYS